MRQWHNLRTTTAVNRRSLRSTQTEWIQVLTLIRTHTHTIQSRENPQKVGHLIYGIKDSINRFCPKYPNWYTKSSIWTRRSPMTLSLNQRLIVAFAKRTTITITKCNLKRISSRRQRATSFWTKLQSLATTGTSRDLKPRFRVNKNDSLLGKSKRRNL